MHNVAFAVIAVCVSDKDSPAVGIDRCNTASRPTGFAELIGHDTPQRNQLRAGVIILSLFLSTAMHAAPCGLHGSASKTSREHALNAFKNRSQAPSAINPHITLGKLGQGSRYDNNEAAAIIGYVALVKPGGKETCNCKAEAPHQDTHIALVTSPAYTNDDSKYVIVEVTPRTRQRYHFPSTATLKKQILHKRVMVTGWLSYDAMHTGNAANTNPNGKKIWRATCEEIHPVSGIKVLH